MNYLRTKGQEKMLLTQIDYKYFEKARQIAQISDYYKTHVGCVAVYHGNIIGIGCNCNKTHPTQKYYNKFRKQKDDLLPKLHAEINCINQIKNLNIDFSKVRLYIYIGSEKINLLAYPGHVLPVWLLLRILVSEIYITQLMMDMFMSE